MTTGRPGPVNLDIPYNLFQEEADIAAEPRGNAFGMRRSGASNEDVAKAADWLLAAKRPVIFIGHGVALSEAGEELTALAETYGIPVISSPNGMGCIDMEHVRSLGFIGRNGDFAANQAGRHADIVLAIGARFDDRSASSWKPGYSWNFPEPGSFMSMSITARSAKLHPRSADPGRCASLPAPAPRCVGTKRRNPRPAGCLA